MNKRLSKKDFALKAKMRMAIVASLALMLVLAMSLSAFAGSVSYEGEAGGFVFSPGSSTSPTDLFTNFTDVMPGDTLTDSVDIKNSSSKEAKIYMRALDATNGKNDFLSQMQLTVDGPAGTVSDAPASQKGGLADWVLIGTFAPGTSTTLNLSLNVPISMGNDYQDAIGSVNWQFKAETEDESEDGEEGEGGSGTKTGDDTNIYIWCGLGALAAVTTAVIVRRRKKSA